MGFLPDNTKNELPLSTAILNLQEGSNSSLPELFCSVNALSLHAAFLRIVSLSKEA